MNDSAIESAKKEIELLSPAGGMECLVAAVDAGADAVYLGVGRLNARRRAENFEGAALAEAVSYAHLRGVKVYAALNALVRGREIEELAESVREACLAGVDAIIVQDWGAARIIRRMAPEMRLHASTQINAHNSPTLELLEEKGFQRVTLARELSIEEISVLAKGRSIELEVFAHGALCFSYSGQCLMASMVGGRSGNRGLCPQVCRLPYEVGRAALDSSMGREVSRSTPRAGRGKGMSANRSGAKRERILSTRDLCAIRLLDRLKEIGISSIKIEGRLKSPDYVAAVTGVYRRALDRLAEGGRYKISDDDLEELELAHSRGFTEGYLSGIRDDRLMSPGRPSDRGLMIGRVAFVDVYSGEVGISLQRSLRLGDVIEVWVSRGGRVRQKVEVLAVDGRPAEKAEPGQRAVITAKEKRHLIKSGDRVFLVERMGGRRRSGGKRIPLEISAVVEEGSPIAVKGKAPDAEVRVVGSAIAETASTKPTSKERVAEQLAKLGGTPYEAASIEVEIRGRPALPVAEINLARRKLVESLDAARMARYRAEYQKRCFEEDFDLAEFRTPGRNRRDEREKMALSVSVTDVPSAKAALASGADRVYLKICSEGLTSGVATGGFFDELPAAVRPSIGNVVKDVEIEKAVGILMSVWGKGIVLCDNLGMARALKDGGFDVLLDYHVNLLNGAACRELADLATAGVTASVEANLEDIKDVCEVSPVPVEVVVHGWIEVMTSEHPLLEARPGSEEAGARLEIRDSKGYRFPVLVDASGRTHIYNAKELCLLEELPKIAGSGARMARLLLDLYSPEEIASVVNIYRRAIDELSIGGTARGALRAAKKAHPSFMDHTTGHFYRPVL